MRLTFDEYVEKRLQDWADWASRRDGHNIGYRKYNILYRIMKEGHQLINSTGEYYPPYYQAAEEIESLVKDLAEHNRKHATALREQYLSRGLQRSKAKKLGISESQFKVHVDLARAWLRGRLSAKSPK
jgi:hypothetical protein